jgi:hypothetical protein
MMERGNMALVTVNGQHFTSIHRSVLDRVAGIADRLGCRVAVVLGSPPASFEGAGLARLRRDLEQIIAFADATRRTGWVLGEIAVAPGDRPERVLETSEGSLWAHAIRGFELRGTAGTRRVTGLPGRPGTARRVPLTDLVEPLARALARAQVMEVHEWAHPPD